MAEFYITLPSNASAAIFPQNRNSNFTIQLARSLDLPGSWEVGLAEIQYPHSWHTLTSPGYFEIANERKRWHFSLRSGYYSSIRQLLENMNNLISNAKDGPKTALQYDSVGRKINLKGDEPHTILVSGELGHLLSTFPGFCTLYVYTDIVELQIVGDFYVPLLRCVPVQGQDNDFITITYDRPHYVPVSKHHIDTVTIEIKTDQDKNVHFYHGKVIVKLHFRPRKSEGWL